MKRYIYRFLPILFAVFSAEAFNSCILDSLNSLPIDVPITIEYHAQGSGTEFTDTESYCLSESDTYEQYVKDVKSITFLGLVYRTKSITPSDLMGDLTLKLFNGNVQFFSKTFTGVKPAAFLPPNPPLKIQLTTDQLDSLNAFLNSDIPNDQKCFTGTIQIHLTNGTNNVTFDAYVDIAIQMETKL